jgi:hypothetical protein
MVTSTGLVVSAASVDALLEQGMFPSVRASGKSSSGA